MNSSRRAGIIGAALATVLASAGLGVALQANGGSSPAGLAPAASSPPQTDEGATPAGGFAHPPAGPGVGPPPSPAPVRPAVTFTVDGRAFTVPAVVERLLDLEGAALLAADVNGRSYVAAESVGDRGTCFMEIPAAAQADPVIGCDEESALASKGGWLVHHQGPASGSRSGVFILPPGQAAVRATAGARTLDVRGRAVVFSDLSEDVEGLQVTTAEGRTLRPTFP